MRFALLLIFAFQLSAEFTIRETAANGAWLEAHIHDDSRLKALLFSDGSSILYEYQDSHLSTITRLDPLGNALYSHSYHWDADQLQSQSGWVQTQYSYDDSGRLLAKLDPWQSATIEYDSLGQAVRIGDRSYSYDPLGQITAEQGYFQTAYDDDYNLIHNPPYDERGLIYDEHNQLVEACQKRYIYDSYGRRTQKDTTSYLYLGFEEIASFENGTCKTLKVPGIGGPIAIEIDGKPYATVIDPQGIIRKLIDPIDRSIYATNDCDIFAGGITAAIPYAYRGKRYDEESGLLYFGKRYYNPSRHRWLTPDPLGPIDHENLYQYVYNNPLRYSDPIGCSFWGYMLGLGEIVAGGTLMLAGGVVEIGSFGTLTLGFVIAETTGAALIGDGLGRAIYNSQDIASYKEKSGNQKDGTPAWNGAQNDQFKDAQKEIERKIGRKLSKEEQKKLHRSISGRNYGYHDVVEEGYWLFNGQ